MAVAYIPHREPTFVEKISSTVSRNAPAVVAKIILLIMTGSVIVYRFIRDMFLEAINKK